MDVLDKLTADQRSLVVSLPYRVGLWVSESDAQGGEEAQEKELTALSNIIEGFSEQVFGSELLQYIMNETVAGKENWRTSWAENVETVPAQCEQALNILREHVDEKEVSAVSTRLIEIGEAVALAFREHQGSASAKLQLYIAYLLSRFRMRSGKHMPKTFDQYLNISLSERKALRALADALGTDYSL